MNNNFREGLNALREISDPEKMKMALERITGKKLADYEGIDALVGALMGYYNGELKKKANSNHTHNYAPNNHTHDDRYYTEAEINTKLDTKEPKIITKNTAFNKNFGTTDKTVLEGSKLAEILGLTYGGSLNTNSAKTVNYAYYDSTTKKVYKCIKATSINYADATYFTAISNNDLLGKFQNLFIVPNYSKIIKLPLKSGTTHIYTVTENGFFQYQFTSFCELHINGIKILYGNATSNQYLLSYNGIYPVKKGDNIKYKSSEYRLDILPIFANFIPL